MASSTDETISDDGNNNLRPNWVDDCDQDTCTGCSNSFTFLNRKHHCRACGQIYCGNCSGQKLELPNLGYMGAQRVCKDCFKTYNKPEINDYRKKRLTIASNIVLDNKMTLIDKYGRPTGVFYFTLSDMSFRWKSKKLVNESGCIALEDILYVKNKGSYSFSVHAFPITTKENDPNNIGKRDQIHIYVQCETTEERTNWVEELITRIPYHLEPIHDTDESHLLILLNPVSGNRSTGLTWEQVEPIFRLSNFELTIRWTSKIGHAYELASSLQYHRFKAIICISGDGTVNEVINGLMSRPDWEQAMRIPIAVIPSGVSNALAAQFQLLDPINASFQILRGKKRSMDLLRVSQGDNISYCFQSIHWGLPSDIGASNSWGNIIKIAYNLKCYKGKVEYLLPLSETPRTFCTLDDQCNECSNYRYSNEDNEGTWEVIDTDLILVTACNLSRISSSVRAAPFAHLADGLIDLIIMENCTRPQLLNLMSSLEDGSFVNSPSFNLSSYIKYLRVKAFKFTPEGDKSKICIDGEYLSSLDPIEVTNCSSVMSILA